MGTIIRLLVVDDHPVVRDGLRAVLSTQDDLEIVGEGADGHAALTLLDLRRPDVVLMDLSMPVMDGVRAITRIRAAAPQVHVLVLTSYATDADITAAVDAGATGYLLKDTPREELFTAIRAAARGESALSPAVATRLLNRLRSPDHSTLSAREIEVLTALARGHTNREIARQLRVSEATVKTHLLHIYPKLSVADRTGAVTAALARGIIRLG